MDPCYVFNVSRSLPVSSPSFSLTPTRDGIGKKMQIKTERIYQRATCTIQEASERAKTRGEGKERMVQQRWRK